MRESRSYLCDIKSPQRLDQPRAASQAQVIHELNPIFASQIPAVCSISSIFSERRSAPRVAQRDEGKQADGKRLPVEERDSGELEKVRAFHPAFEVIL
jgi:hypothetical protein